MGYTVRKRGRGEYYWIFGWIKGVRLDASLKTKVKKEADEIAKDKVRKVLERAYSIRAVKPIRLKILFDKYIDYCKNNNRASTVRAKVPFLNHALAFFGDCPLTSLTSEQLEAFKTHRRQTVGPATVNRELAAIKHAFRLAVEWSYLEVSPATRVAKLKEPPGRLRYLTPEEASSLLTACHGNLYYIVTTALYTGMRRSEIFNLDWRDVDLKRRQIRIVDSKNNDSRVVPINKILYNALASMAVGTGKVFTNNRGQPYKSIRTSFEKALKRAGINEFTFHDLRHTFASWLAMKGVPTSTIGKLLGHKTPQMTLRYAHLGPDYLAEVVELLTQNSHKTG